MDFPLSVFFRSGTNPYLNDIDSFCISHPETKPKALFLLLKQKKLCIFSVDGSDGRVAESRTVVAGGVV